MATELSMADLDRQTRCLLAVAAHLVSDTPDKETSMSFEHFLEVDHFDDLVADWLAGVVNGDRPITDGIRRAYQDSAQCADDYDQWAGP